MAPRQFVVHQSISKDFKSTIRKQKSEKWINERVYIRSGARTDRVCPPLRNFDHIFNISF